MNYIITSSSSLISFIKIITSVALLLSTTFFSSSSVHVSAFGTDKTSLFSQSHSVMDLDKARLTFISPVADSCPWVVLFYDSMCGHCREFSQPFSEFSEKYLLHRGVFVGAINCASHEALCLASNVSDVPTIFAGFPSAVANNNNDNRNKNKSEGNNNNIDEEKERMISLNEAIKDASPYVKSGTGGGKSLKVANPHQGWRVATSEVPQDASDAQILEHLKELVILSLGEEEHGGDHNPNQHHENADKNNNKNNNAMCREVVGTLCMKKKQLIDFTSYKQKEEQDQSKHHHHHHATTPFLPPPNHPCPQDLAGALYIALKHEVAVGFSTVLAQELQTLYHTASSSGKNNQNQNHDELLQLAASSPKYKHLLHTTSEFLTYVDTAIPELRAGEVLELIQRDPLAPTKTEDGVWGYQVYNILFRGLKRIKTFDKSNNNGDNNNNNNFENERDYVVFDEEEDEDKHHDPEHHFSPSITSIVWSSCRGSTPNYRGYTCGLWMLFHTVLSNSPYGKTANALRSLHDYILHFFMCLECRVHFSQFQFHEFEEVHKNDGDNNINHQEGAAGTDLNKGKKKDADFDAVMWLFHVHNAVNRRLAISGRQSQSSASHQQSTSSSTDPLVPKLQFPSQELCPGGCHSKSSEQELYLFLKNHYNWRKISRSSAFCHRISNFGDAEKMGRDKKKAIISQNTLKWIALGVIVALVIIMVFVFYVLRNDRRLNLIKNKKKMHVV